MDREGISSVVAINVEACALRVGLKLVGGMLLAFMNSDPKRNWEIVFIATLVKSVVPRTKLTQAIDA